MQTLKQNIYGFAALLLLSSMFLPLLLSSSASAATITNRSIEMSNSVPSATGVSYTLRFEPGSSATTIRGIVIDFCSDSPLMSATCTNPTGMTNGSTLDFLSISGDGGSDVKSGWTAAQVASGDAMYIHNATGVSMGSSNDVVIRVNGFVNPSTEGTFYARIFTYGSNTTANNYTSTSPGASLDYGAVAMFINQDIEVSARVRESLTFCVSGSAPGAGCTSLTTPSLVLGQGSGTSTDGLALDTATVSEAAAYFQLSTNSAISTAIKMRNGAASGGLNSGSNSIPAINQATPTALTTGVAGFGVRVPASSTGDVGSAAVTAATPYSSSTAGTLNMRTTEVTAPYGDVLAEATGPVSNVNVPVTFGAQASNLTAAGIYTAAITLVATSVY